MPSIDRLYSQPSASGQATDSIPFAGHVNVYVLLTDASQTIAIPAGTEHMIFSCTGDFYATPGASATKPTATSEAGAAPELNPVMRHVKNMTQVSVVAPAGATLTVAFFK